MGGGRWVGWRQAWERAQLMPGGFYRSRGPTGQFRTAAADHAQALAPALLRLLRDVDARLGRPPALDLVDVGAGDGALVARVLALAGQPGDGDGHRLVDRLRVTAVDVRGRPAGLDPRVEWVRGRAPDVLAAVRPGGLVGLVMAWEWLDDVPCDLVVHRDGAWHLLLVDPRTGEERAGPRLDDAPGCAALGVEASAVAGWLADRRTRPDDGARGEVGWSRDAAWVGLVDRLTAGTALAVDYVHPHRDGAVLAGTVAGYRDGRRVPVAFDGSVNVTAHVALDSCAAAALRTGRIARSTLTDQATALRRLGVDATPPPVAVAGAGTGADPRGYVAALAAAGSAAVLTDPAGLGGFGWLQQDVTDRRA